MNFVSLNRGFFIFQVTVFKFGDLLEVRSWKQMQNLSSISPARPKLKKHWDMRCELQSFGLTGIILEIF